MENRYAGDVGDFSKFMLMKHVFGNFDWKMGIVWYAYPNENHNNDGRHLAYLRLPTFRKADEKLINQLQTIAAHPERLERGIELLENAEIIKDCIYYSENIMNTSRDDWFIKAKETVRECNIVFLDPDNGMEILTNRRTGKYVRYAEVKSLLESCECVVVYQHFHKGKPHRQQLIELTKKFRDQVNPPGFIFAVRFRGYSPRAYFILCSKSAEPIIRKAISDFTKNMQLSIGWDFSTHHFIDEGRESI
jgi:hypothetical protein